MAEAVDRLELVADEEELGLGRPEQVDDLRLEPVRVLELVDEDRAEAGLFPLPELRMRAQERARLELQVREVECRLARLRVRVFPGEQGEELLQERPVAGGGLVERSLLDRSERLAVRRRPVSARLE